MSRQQVTATLQAWKKGDPEAAERLMPLVYDELHRMAARYLGGERRGHTLQTTDLVHEAYLRLVDQRTVDWRERGHFFAIAARTMRRVLLDHARRHLAAKRDGGHRLPLISTLDLVIDKPPELIALDEALKDLAELDAEKAQMVELRFFGGLTIEETAAALGSSTATVTRQWRTARAWLYHHLHA